MTTEISNGVKKIEQARRLAFPDFDKISLGPKAVRVLANLFLNPDCQTDIDLSKFIKHKSIKLNQISPHIITAAPSTIAQYAKDHNKKRINQNDILKCFAIDHAQAIKDNCIDVSFSPCYSLSHILNVGRIIKIKQVHPVRGRFSSKTVRVSERNSASNGVQEKKIVDLEKKVKDQVIIFKNILVPFDLKVFKNQQVFYHFGVVVALAHTPKLIGLANEIKKQQKKEHFIYKMNQRAKKRRKLIIDAQDKTIFHEDLMEKIILGNQGIEPAKPDFKTTGKRKIVLQK